MMKAAYSVSFLLVVELQEGFLDEPFIHRGKKKQNSFEAIKNIQEFAPFCPKHKKEKWNPPRSVSLPLFQNKTVWLFLLK